MVVESPINNNEKQSGGKQAHTTHSPPHPHYQFTNTPIKNKHHNYFDHQSRYPPITTKKITTKPPPQPLQPLQPSHHYSHYNQATTTATTTAATTTATPAIQRPASKGMMRLLFAGSQGCPRHGPAPERGLVLLFLDVYAPLAVQHDGLPREKSL